MKLNEVKQLREDTMRRQLQEMFPDASPELINEALPAALAGGVKAGANFLKKAGQTAVKGAKIAGKAAVKGAKVAAPIVKKAAVAGKDALVKGGKKVAGELGQAYQGAKKIGSNVVKATGDVASAMGDVAADVKAHSKAKADRMRAAQRSKLAGGKNAAKFARGVDDISQGKAVTGAIASELAPHIANLETILANPQLTTKWLQLVKQAKQMRKA